VRGRGYREGNARRPIEDDADACLVAAINKYIKSVGDPKRLVAEK